MKTQKNLPVNWCSIDIFIKEYQMRLVWGEWRCQVAREVSTTSNHTNDLHRFHWNVKGDVICQRVQLLFTKKGARVSSAALLLALFTFLELSWAKSSNWAQSPRGLLGGLYSNSVLKVAQKRLCPIFCWNQRVKNLVKQYSQQYLLGRQSKQTLPSNIKGF